MKKILLLFFGITALNVLSYSQNERVVEIGAGAGISYYLGDYNKIPFYHSRPSAGVFYRHNLDKRFALKGSFNILRIAGNKNSIPQAKKIWYLPDEFATKIYDLNAVGEFNFIPYIPANKKYLFSPYVLAGVGLNFFEDMFNKFQFVIPFGVGIKYTVWDNYTIALETSFYKTFTDFIDYEYATINDKNVRNAGKQKNYNGNNDWYSFFGIKMSYCIKYPIDCYVFE